MSQDEIRKIYEDISNRFPLQKPIRYIFVYLKSFPIQKPIKYTKIYLIGFCIGNDFFEIS